MVRAEIENRIKHMKQIVDKRRVLLRSLVHNALQLCKGFAENFLKQLFLRLEKGVNRPFAYICDFGYEIHRRRFIAQTVQTTVPPLSKINVLRSIAIPAPPSH